MKIETENCNNEIFKKLIEQRNNNNDYHTHFKD